MKMNYSTLNGVTSKLTELKSCLTTLKSKCNSDILMLEDDQWSNVKNYLQDIIDQVDNAINNWPTTYGEEMKKIVNGLPKSN